MQLHAYDAIDAALAWFGILMGTLALWGTLEWIVDLFREAKVDRIRRRLAEGDARVDRSRYATRSHLRPLV